MDTTADLGTSNAIEKKTTQTVDIHGNVTQVNNYNWGSLSDAARTYNYSYLSSGSYPSLYIFNRLTSATVTHGSTNLTLASIYYDQFSLGSVSGAREWDSSYTSSVTARGNPTTMTDVSGNTTTATYNLYGNTTAAYVNGVASTASISGTTNYAAPDSITVNSTLTTSMTYSSFLGVTSQTAPDTATVDIGYDSYARPTSSTSPFGATTYYVYNDSATPPNSCTSVNTRWTETILDGLGRTLKVLTGSYTSSGQTACASASGAITLTETDTSYGSCGCSPLGKMMSQTVPYTYGGSVGASTAYTYDGIGRTLTVTTGGSDTTGETQYSYAGNAVTVTDPAGKVKVFTMDAFGNLTQVVENPSGLDYVSTYTYDLVNHLTGVSMTRPGFSTAQTRSFAYSGNNLTSATNPENGTVSYTYYGSGYNGFGKIATRTDAKGQEVVYTYDSYSRLSEVQRYPTSGTEDVCQREVYYYDGSSPSGSAYPANAAARLSAVQYWGGYNTTVLPTCDTTFTEMYTYATSGAPVGKQLQVARTLEWASYSEWVPESVTLSATFSYDNEGRMTGETYPTDNSGTTANLSYTFDSMGRLNTMTDNIASKTLITGASYGPANELLSVTGGSYGGAWAYGVGETRTYNSLKQLTEIVSGTYSTPLSITYNYPSTGNNGRIGSQTDGVSGEQVTYTYDTLNRLEKAANQSGFSRLWGQQFTYDGFGNLTEVSVTQGSAPTLSATYDANNHAGGEDANGNPGSIYLPADGSPYAATYDVENRLVATGGSGIRYSYAPGNKRVWRGVGSWNSGTGQWSPTDEVTFWSVTGQKLATYQLTTTLGVGPPEPSAPAFYATQTACNYYFGGRLIKNGNGNSWVYSDRLGSIGKFYPYGMERPSATTNGTEKFTGYFRDAETGNDYAVNRYASPGLGRFLTPDPSSDNWDPADPGSWNTYAYTGGDPVNYLDPSGLGTCAQALTDNGNGPPFGSLINSTTDLGVLIETMFTESAQTNQGQGPTEIASIGAVIMNRYQILNGYWWVLNSGGTPIQVSPDWGPNSATISQIAWAPSQFAVWASPGTLTASAQNNLNAAENSTFGSNACLALADAYYDAEAFLAAENQHALYYENGLALTSFNSFNPPHASSTWEQPVGSFGSNNVFYGVPATQTEWVPGVYGMPLPQPPRPPRRPGKRPVRPRPRIQAP